jgi:hypothetical protein
MKTVKNKAILLSSSFFFLGSSLLMANGDVNHKDTPINSSVISQRVFDVGPEIFYAHIKQPRLASMNRVGVGVNGAYQYLSDNFFMRFEGRIGTSLTSIHRTLGSRLFFDIRPLIGGNIGLPYQFSPYTGIGYEQFVGRKLYIPLGLQWSNRIDDWWGMKVQAEVDVLLRGWARDSFHYIQKSGHGLRVSVAFDKRGETHDWGIEPFVRGWCIRDSHTKRLGKDLYRIPKYRTLETGIKISFKL